MKLNRSRFGTLCLMAVLAGCGSDADPKSSRDESSTGNALPNEPEQVPASVNAGDAGTEEEPEINFAGITEYAPELNFEGITQFPEPPKPEEPPPPAIIPPDLGAPTMPDTERAKLIQKLLQDSAYADKWFPHFEKTSARRELIVKPAHSSDQVRVFENDVARSATSVWASSPMKDALRLPPGSIVVKELYKANALTSVLVMAKVPGLNPMTYEGGWYFMRISANTNAAEPGSTGCVACHNGRTQKSLWPVSAEAPAGGKADALVSHDYLYGAFCFDPATTECDPAH